MNTLLAVEVLVCVVLFSAVAVLVIKAYRRLQCVPGGRVQRGRPGERQPGLLLFFIVSFLVCVTLSTLYYASRFLPVAVASPADGVVPLFNTTVIITGIAFFITHILLFWFAFRYRAKSDHRASYITGSLRLELVWTVVPLAAFIFLFLWGQSLWARINDAAVDGALVLHVMGEQFNWKVRYPGRDGVAGRSAFGLITESNPFGLDLTDPRGADDFVPVQMHIPKNQPVKLLLHSHDVIHSFFIPHFHLKMDAVPGMVTTLQFTATTSTAEMRERLGNPDFNYEVACAELCGRMHFGMKLILVVDEPEAFDAWHAIQPPLSGQFSKHAIVSTTH